MQIAKKCLKLLPEALRLQIAMKIKRNIGTVSYPFTLPMNFDETLFRCKFLEPTHSDGFLWLKICEIYM